MTGTDIATMGKLREMAATALFEAIKAQDDVLVLRMDFEQRLRLMVARAHCGSNHAKVGGLIRRAGLRCPGDEVRRLDLVEERGLDRDVIAQLGTCSFIEGQGFTGPGKPYLGCAWLGPRQPDSYDGTQPGAGGAHKSGRLSPPAISPAPKVNIG